MEIRRMLRDIQENNPDNWDGKGAAQPNDLVLRRADLALDMLASMKFTQQEVVPSIEDGIAITFKKDGRYAEIEFFNAGDMCYALFDNVTEVEVNSFESTKGSLRRTLHKVQDFIEARAQA